MSPVTIIILSCSAFNSVHFLKKDIFLLFLNYEKEFELRTFLMAIPAMSVFMFFWEAFYLQSLEK